MRKRPPSVGIPGMGPGPSQDRILATIPAVVRRGWERTRERGYDNALPYDRAADRAQSDDDDGYSPPS